MPEDRDASPPTTSGLDAASAGGMVRDLVQWPDARLRMRAEPSGYLTGPETQALAADLLATMYAAGGQGLAAPQIGVPRRVFVMDMGAATGQRAPRVLLDPELIWQSPDQVTQPERCLSVPGRDAQIARSGSITLAWYDLDGRHVLEQMTDQAARTALHALDLLDGRLIVED